MGYKLIKFCVTPEENEQIDAIIEVPVEKRSVIHGVVMDECNKPVEDAVVKLLMVKCRGKHTYLEPITHAFTDDCGQFLFGPLCPHVEYVIKVWINHVNIRELIIKPDCNDDPCMGDENCDDHCRKPNKGKKYEQGFQVDFDE